MFFEGAVQRCVLWRDRTQKNKATAKHLGDLKAKLCAARRDACSAIGRDCKANVSEELLAPEKSGGGKSKGFEARRPAAFGWWSGPKIWRLQGLL